MKEKVLNMLVDMCEEEAIREDLDIDLFETGLIDSLGYAELLVLVEDEFGIIISPSEMEREELSTPRKIIRVIEARL